MTIINTKRLVLRPFKEEDFEDTLRIYSEESTCKYLPFESWTDLSGKQEFKEKIKNNSLLPNTPLNLAVVLDNRVIGDLFCWYTEMKGNVEVGYVFSRKIYGKGYATEGVRALVEWLFKEKKVHRIQANLDARNNDSAKLCQRIGMRKEAYFVEDYWNKGEWTDSIIYGMLERDLE